MKIKQPAILVFFSLLLGALSFLGSTLAVRLPGFANRYSRSVYRVVSQGISRITGLLPFSITELLLYLLLLFVLFGLPYGIFRTWKERKGLPLILFVTRLLCIAALLYFLYVFLCGINYRRDSFTREAGIQVRSYSEEELRAVTAQLVQEAQELEAALLADAKEHDNSAGSVLTTGGLTLSDQSAGSARSFLRLAGEEGQRSMTALGQTYSRLSLTYPQPKFLLNSRLLTVQQITGIYTPFTVEANVNREIPTYNVPFVVCHELSHLAGYMQEEEANFIAFLACHESEDLYFRYASVLSGFVYVGNAYARVDAADYSALYHSLPEYAKASLSYERDFWDRYETEISEAADRVNDGYLKANGQASGTKSYGHVADLILWYYLDR